MNNLEHNEMQDLRSQLIQHIESELQMVRRLQQLNDVLISMSNLVGSETDLKEFRTKIIQLIIDATPKKNNDNTKESNS